MNEFMYNALFNIDMALYMNVLFIVYLILWIVNMADTGHIRYPVIENWTFVTFSIYICGPFFLSYAAIYSNIFNDVTSALLCIVMLFLVCLPNPTFHKEHVKYYKTSMTLFITLFILTNCYLFYFVYNILSGIGEIILQWK